MSSELFLDRNENLYGPAPACFETLKKIGVNELSVYPRDYLRGVKSNLSERLAGVLHVPEPQILLSEGSEDMLKQAVHCYLGPGEKILAPAQSWWYYQKVASEVGGETITYALKVRDGAYAYDVDEMVALYEKESPSVVLIASPNNPTGNSFHDADLQRLAEAFRESIVILDEAYWGFADSSNEHISSLIEHYRNILVLRTFSKYYALAGARIAYAAAGSSLSRLTRFASRYLGYNRISEALALAALDSSAYYEEVRRRMCADRRELCDFLATLKEWTCYRSDANFVLVKMPPGVPQRLQPFLRERGIHIKFFTEEGFASCARITIGTQEQSKRLLGALSEFADGVPSGRGAS